MKAQTGPILYADIMGYKDIMESNDIGDITDKVLAVIRNAPAAAVSQYTGFARKNGQKEVADVIDLSPPSQLIYADTILVAWDISQLPHISQYVIWLYAISMAGIITSQLFLEGLPARAVLHYGLFAMEKDCFAGKGVIEAHNLASNLAFSACVLSTDASNALNATVEEPTTLTAVDGLCMGNHLIKYLAPFKDGSEQTLYMPNLGRGCPELIGGDISQTVHKAFWAHNKSIPLSVQPKLSNTEQFFRRMKCVKSQT